MKTLKAIAGSEWIGLTGIAVAMVCILPLVAAMFTDNASLFTLSLVVISLGVWLGCREV